MSILTRVKEWVDMEVLEASDLNAEFDAIVNNIIAGTTASVGVVQLEDSHASVSVTKAACPKNVKEAYDLAGTAGDKIIEGNTSVEVIDTGGGYIVFTEDGSEVGRITGGKFGLGTNNPQEKMHILGTAYPRLEIESTDAQGGSLKLTSSTGCHAIYQSGTDLKFWDTQDRVVFNAGGNVDILSGTLDMNTHKIIGVGDPTAAQDVATKAYGDANWAGGGGSLWTDGGTYSYLTEEAGNTRLHNTGLLSLEATGGTTHPLIATSKWGFSTSFTETGDRLLVLGTGDHTSSPAIWIEKDYISTGTPAGDPTIPVGLYVGHEHTGTGTGFTHSIMGYALNGGTGNNDVIAVSGRARKIGAGVGDACGIWGSAYNDINQNGGVMALEGSIYQNAAGLSSGQDNIGAKWSVALHLNSVSTTENALAAIAIDASNSYGFWNGILFDKEMWRDAVGGTAGMAGTVAINMGNFDNTHKPQYGIKFGFAHAHLKCTDSLSLESNKSFFSYIDGTENFVWRKGTYASSSDLMVLSDAGALNVKQVIIEPSSGNAHLYIDSGAAGDYGRVVLKSNNIERFKVFANDSASYQDYTGSLTFRTIAGANKVIFDSGGNITADGTIQELQWTLQEKDIKDKWSLIGDIRNAYKTHSGKNLPVALRVKTVLKNKDNTETIKYGKRPSDFIQIAIECIAELEKRIRVLEGK